MKTPPQNSKICLCLYFDVMIIQSYRNCLSKREYDLIRISCEEFSKACFTRFFQISVSLDRFSQLQELVLTSKEVQKILWQPASLQKGERWSVILLLLNVTICLSWKHSACEDAILGVVCSKPCQPFHVSCVVEKYQRRNSFSWI